MENQHSGNLVPQSKRTKNEQREIAKSGGVASGEARRKKKLMREIAQAMLNGALPESMLNEYGLEPGTTGGTAIMLAQIGKALTGDTRAAEFVRDTAGEKPVQEVESSIDVGMSDADRRLLEKVGARLGNNR